MCSGSSRSVRAPSGRNTCAGPVAVSDRSRCSRRSHRRRSPRSSSVDAVFASRSSQCIRMPSAGTPAAAATSPAPPGPSRRCARRRCRERQPRSPPLAASRSQSAHVGDVVGRRPARGVPAGDAFARAALERNQEVRRRKILLDSQVPVERLPEIPGPAAGTRTAATATARHILSRRGDRDPAAGASCRPRRASTGREIPTSCGRAGGCGSRRSRCRGSGRR